MDIQMDVFSMLKLYISERIQTQLDSNPENRLERMKKKELPKKFSSGNVLKWQENWSDPLLALVFLIIQSGMSTVVRQSSSFHRLAEKRSLIVLRGFVSSAHCSPNLVLLKQISKYDPFKASLFVKKKILKCHSKNETINLSLDRHHL